MVELAIWAAAMFISIVVPNVFGISSQVDVFFYVHFGVFCLHMLIKEIKITEEIGTFERFIEVGCWWMYVFNFMLLVFLTSLMSKAFGISMGNCYQLVMLGRCFGEAKCEYEEPKKERYSKYVVI